MSGVVILLAVSSILRCVYAKMLSTDAIKFALECVDSDHNNPTYRSICKSYGIEISAMVVWGIVEIVVFACFMTSRYTQVTPLNIFVSVVYIVSTVVGLMYVHNTNLCVEYDTDDYDEDDDL